MSDEGDVKAGDEGDEFAALGPTARARNPILAAAVILLAGLICWHLRDDVRYAFAARKPADLGDARTFATRGVELRDDTYVTIAGQAERRYALYVEPKGERERQTIFRVLGAKQMLFVRAADDIERTDLAERWTGRLRRFDAVPYASSLRKYYGGTEVTRYLDLASLKSSLQGGAGELRDRMGEPLTVAPAQPVVVVVDFPGELKVYLSKDKFPSLGDARHELERLQLSPSPGEETKDEFVFIVPMPEARKNEIVAALANLEVAFQPREERYTVTRGDLKLDGDTLQVGARDKAPWARVKAVGVPSPVLVGHDAFILLEGEAPSLFWWAPLVMALLVAFAAFNVWYLLRSFSRPRA